MDSNPSVRSDHAGEAGASAARVRTASQCARGANPYGASAHRRSPACTATGAPARDRLGTRCRGRSPRRRGTRQARELRRGADARSCDSWDPRKHRPPRHRLVGRVGDRHEAIRRQGRDEHLSVSNHRRPCTSQDNRELMCEGLFVCASELLDAVQAAPGSARSLFTVHSGKRRAGPTPPCRVADSRVTAQK